MNRPGEDDEAERDEPDFADEHTHQSFDHEHDDESTVGGDERAQQSAVDQDPPRGPV